MNVDPQVELDACKADIIWLAGRLDWPPHPQVGISSNALVVATVLGGDVPIRNYPCDEGDYLRCAYAVGTSPVHRRSRAIEILAQFRAALDGTEKALDTGGPIS